MKHYSTKESLFVGFLCFIVFIILVSLSNLIYPFMTIDFAIFCGLGVGVGNFLMYRFFIPKN